MIPQTLTELIAALTALAAQPPIERARAAPGLIDAAKSVLATVRGQALQEACTSGGWTIPALARELGVHRSKIDDVLARARSRATTPSPPAAAADARDIDPRHITPAGTARPEPTTPTPTTPPPAARVVNLSTELGPGWQLIAQDDALGQNIWRLHRHGVPVGTVRRDATITGRRGWRASIDGVLVPAHGQLAATGSSTLWRTRDLAATGLAHHLQTHPRRRSRGHHSSTAASPVPTEPDPPQPRPR